MITRREAIQRVVLASTSVVAGSQWVSKVFSEPVRMAGEPYTLPPLPYDYSALEPIIDAETMHLHHDKHHAGYVKNLNQAIALYPELGKKAIEDLISDLDGIPENIRSLVRNHGGGHANHSLFWQIMTRPGGNSEPEGEFLKALSEKFGSYLKFKDTFTTAATKVFGSGWAWLSFDRAKQLIVETTSNQDSPLFKGHVPLFGIDVWEHAYYLKYQNRRADYLDAFFKVIHWERVNERFLAFRG